jgi:hypothetical protein
MKPVGKADKIYPVYPRTGSEYPRDQSMSQKGRGDEANLPPVVI